MSTVFDFHTQLAFSTLQESEFQKVQAAFDLPLFGPATLTYRRSLADDRAGCDYVLTYAAFPDIAFSAEIKTRSSDPQRFGKDDLAIEWWSDIERGKPGWSIDPSKRSDFILTVFRDTGRIAGPYRYRELRAAANAHFSDWRASFRPHRQQNSGWISECSFIPRSALEAAMTATQLPTYSTPTATPLPSWSGSKGDQS